jgi:hypothetical protein
MDLMRLLLSGVERYIDTPVKKIFSENMYVEHFAAS